MQNSLTMDMKNDQMPTIKTDGYIAQKPNVSKQKDESFCAVGEAEKNNMFEYLIITEPDNEKVDEEILKFLRKYRISFNTGFYYNRKASANMRACIWYLFVDRKMKIESLNDSAFSFNYGNCKIMSSDGKFFCCNCKDMDLPMIEDVYEEIVTSIGE